MKMLTVFLHVCVMMTFTHSLSLPEETIMPALPEETIVPDGDYWGTPPSPPFTEDDSFGGWHPSCPDGWSMHSQQCLIFVPENMTWDDAQNNCHSHGGQLASVYDDFQAYEIQAELKRAGHDHGEFWVGGHNSPGNPSWSWSDYMGISAFADFCNGDTVKEEHHCLQITFTEEKSGCLESMDCETELPSICGNIIM
ncbi:lactose-binding lectin l-2-like isoform X2 [Simochromis diagramma]|uniref:lactose-binding lectin l-2-like isoform X2 n=1 Tax=Simochromis diagramma TaxID=43689 RepID=UPI001A7EC317|nr:lactose-binding lectin l-2-like isoform X2 [Simochromis diagramma]